MRFDPKDRAALLEHLWHAALTVNPDLEAKDFDPAALPQMVQAALDDAEAEVESLATKLKASRKARKQRLKKLRQDARRKVENARAELEASKAASKHTQHELYVALKAAEERGSALRASHYALSKKLAGIDQANTFLQSQVLSMQRNNDTAERDLGALIHMAEELCLPGSMELDQQDYDYDRLVEVISQCYERICSLEKWMGLR